jgi:GNAT superfamily N-acetyltransferase
MNSLGLRHQGEAIGWIVTHRVAPDTIRYSSLFVDAKYQKLGRGISLLSQSIQRQIASEIENYTFSVAWENQPMIKFLERHLRPYLTGMGSSRKTVKPLTP